MNNDPSLECTICKMESDFVSVKDPWVKIPVIWSKWTLIHLDVSWQPHVPTNVSTFGIRTRVNALPHSVDMVKSWLIWNSVRMDLIFTPSQVTGKANSASSSWWQRKLMSSVVSLFGILLKLPSNRVLFVCHWRSAQRKQLRWRCKFYQIAIATMNLSPLISSRAEPEESISQVQLSDDWPIFS